MNYSYKGYQLGHFHVNSLLFLGVHFESGHRRKCQLNGSQVTKNIESTQAPTSHFKMARHESEFHICIFLTSTMPTFFLGVYDSASKAQARHVFYAKKLCKVQKFCAVPTAKI